LVGSKKGENTARGNDRERTDLELGDGWSQTLERVRFVEVGRLERLAM